MIFLRLKKYHHPYSLCAFAFSNLIITKEPIFNMNLLHKNFILNEIILFLLDHGNQVTVFRHDLFAS
ncbi:hypothetical protein EMIT036CA2_60120 [Chryseobacterium sp. IT-36CA2]